MRIAVGRLSAAPYRYPLSHAKPLAACFSNPTVSISSPYFASAVHREFLDLASNMAVSTVKTRIFIISDTHSAVNGRDTSAAGSFRPPFPKADILLHTGDLTQKGRPEEYRSSLKLLASIPAELKLVIAGNHDLSLDKDYYLEKKAPILIYQQDYQEQNAELAEQIWTGDEAKAAGVTYLTEGYHRFNLSNGAEFGIYTSPWQPECTTRPFMSLQKLINSFITVFNWAFNYAHNEDRWNPPELISKEPFLKDRSQKVVPPAQPGHYIPSDDVDIIMTHGPPWQHLDQTSRGIFAGCPQLLQALDRVRPRLHCFGHIHEVNQL
jgi:Icc-related predicted phosphoesterase